MTHVNAIKRRLGTESIEALTTFHRTGELPDAKRVPLLMEIWRAAKDAIVGDGADHSRWAHQHGQLRFEVRTLWDADGQLVRFHLVDPHSGAVLIVGDQNGPVLPTMAERGAT